MQVRIVGTGLRRFVSFARDSQGARKVHGRPKTLKVSACQLSRRGRLWFFLVHVAKLCVLTACFDMAHSTWEVDESMCGPFGAWFPFSLPYIMVFEPIN